MYLVVGLSYIFIRLYSVTLVLCKTGDCPHFWQLSFLLRKLNEKNYCISSKLPWPLRLIYNIVSQQLTVKRNLAVFYIIHVPVFYHIAFCTSCLHIASLSRIVLYVFWNRSVYVGVLGQHSFARVSIIYHFYTQTAKHYIRDTTLEVLFQYRYDCLPFWHCLNIFVWKFVVLICKKSLFSNILKLHIIKL